MSQCHGGMRLRILECMRTLHAAVLFRPEVVRVGSAAGAALRPSVRQAFSRRARYHVALVPTRRPAQAVSCTAPARFQRTIHLFAEGVNVLHKPENPPQAAGVWGGML